MLSVFFFVDFFFCGFITDDLLVAARLKKYFLSSSFVGEHIESLFSDSFEILSNVFIETTAVEQLMIFCSLLRNYICDFKSRHFFIQWQQSSYKGNSNGWTHRGDRWEA